MARALQWLRETSGASAVEFVLIAPFFLALVMGLYNMSAVMWATASLQAATEAAARCAAVQTTVCGSTSDVNTWANERYGGPGISPSFVLTNNSTGGCGYQVDATGTFTVVAIVWNPTLTLSAQACFAA